MSALPSLPGKPRPCGLCRQHSPGSHAAHHVLESRLLQISLLTPKKVIQLRSGLFLAVLDHFITETDSPFRWNTLRELDKKRVAS